VRAFLRRLRYRFRQRRIDRDLREEIDAHRSMLQERFERTGLSPGDALTESRRALGNVTLAREDAREPSRWTTIESLGKDIRFGARALRRSPALAAIAVLTLALGIGANTAIFTVVRTVVLRPLPYREPDRPWSCLRDPG